MTCVVQITGYKDVGKTVVAERIVKKLKEAGYVVVAVKLSHHEPEPPTKDTYRLRRAGADRVLFYNGEVFVLYTKEAACGDIAADYVVVEGMRDRKVGYKIHVGPDPPPDADVVIQNIDVDIEVKCVEVDICHILEMIKSHRPK
ncbi:MAG: molybdopterin-guanine dinucleotide biosynthesis protein B [Pyrobaculum sp.]